MIEILAVATAAKPCPLTPAGWFMGTLICAFLGFLFSATIKRLFKRRPLNEGEKGYRLIQLDPAKPKKEPAKKTPATLEPQPSNLPD